jgi:Tfp pilus assembly protein PilF
MLVRLKIAALGALVLAGCGTVSTCNDGGGGIRLFGKDAVEQKLDIGVKEYEEGNYVASMNALQSVLETKLANKDDKLSAYKYLAFIHCISSREKLCKDYFRKVLAINPNFELSPAEAGHPIWGPAFRSVKGKPGK